MKRIASSEPIEVGINFGRGVIPVGRLLMLERKIWFEYYLSFIEQKLEISPLHLPLKLGVSRFDYSLFEGLPGVFNDSLPDGWGRLLFDRYVRAQGILPADMTPLDRLTHVGAHGVGALVYEPDHSADLQIGRGEIILDKLANQVKKVLAGTAEEALQELLVLHGSSAGARPKALIGVDDSRKHIVYGACDLPAGYAPWMVKFANTQDGPDMGAVEYVYALMAKKAGVHMPAVHLFPVANSAGCFAVQRFDRDGAKRFHMHTACGLLHSDFRAPSLDYSDLIALTYGLTRDVGEVEKMYQLAVFNVLAYNRDDHAKNFSFLMDEQGQWKLSPAYDLSFSSGPGGEQSTMVMGEGRRPGVRHLLKLGDETDLSKSRIHDIIAQTKAALSEWQTLAKEHGVDTANIKLIAEKIAAREP